MENRLVPAGNDMELLYDPLGRLYQIGRKSGTKTYFLYDGDNLVAEYQNGVMTKRYVHGDGMQAPLISYDGGSITNSSIQFLHTNHQGSVIALSDSEGAATAVNTYDPFGGVGSLTGRFGYTGQMFLPELDLYYYRARIYNPALGRFLQTDPVGYEDQMNLYAYVGNDPINLIDPTGMQSACDDSIADICYDTNIFKEQDELDGLRDKQKDAVETRAKEVAGEAGWQILGWLGFKGLGKIAKGTAQKIDDSLVRFGNNSNQTHHVFRHTDELGLNREVVQAKVQNHLTQVASQITPGKPFNQVIEVGGQRLQYTAFKLEDGTINVGRIHGAP